MISGHTRVYALLGHPVRHSLSPALHNALFDRHRLDAVYVALDVPEPRLLDLAGALRGLGLAGVNLTVPLKQQILDQLDEISPMGAALGAVNVVLRHDDGRLEGHNTDGDGFLAGLVAEHGPVTARSAVLLGAGGASRGVAAALASAGVGRITVLNRTVARAEHVVHTLEARFPEVRFEVGPLEQGAFLGAEPQLVVHATSAGGRPAVQALDPSGLAPGTWVDLNYWDPDPPHLAQCSTSGWKTQDGLPMLLHQGLLAFRLFTGVDPDVHVGRQALDRARQP